MRIRREVVVAENVVMTSTVTLPTIPIPTEEFDAVTVLWSVSALSGTSPSMNISTVIQNQDLNINIDSETVINNITATWHGAFRAQRLGFGLRIRFVVSGTNPSFTVWCRVILEKER